MISFQAMINGTFLAMAFDTSQPTSFSDVGYAIDQDWFDPNERPIKLSEMAEEAGFKHISQLLLIKSFYSYIRAF